MSSIVYPESPVIIIDDDKNVLDALTGVLRSAGVSNVLTCSDSRNVWPMMEEHSPSLLLLDLTMPHISGETLLEEIGSERPGLPVIIITGNDDLGTAVRCMKLGAVDYLVKAIENSKLLASVKNALRLGELREENSRLKGQLLATDKTPLSHFNNIDTADKYMLSIFSYLNSIASLPYPVLIRGETGTGKELIAEAVHRASSRKGNFIKVNAAGLDDTMFSDTLFGHKKGAYTGAVENRAGLIEQASGGTIFLDEIGDLNSGSQIKLLRLIEQNEYYPLGSDIQKTSSCRIIAATNQNVETLLKEGTFRKDLYYRLSTYEVHIPPLRERKEDIPLLADLFLEVVSKEMNRPVPEVKSGFYERLLELPLPGNIRELKSIIMNSLAVSNKKNLTAEDIDNSTGTSSTKGTGADTHSSADTIQFPEELPTLKECTEQIIDEALSRTGGNISKAATLLGLSQPALSRRLARRDDSE